MADAEKKTVLVTGGAGFIGSFLCEQLLKSGSRVICIDNFTTGHVRTIESLLRSPDFQFLKLDINQPFDLETFTELEPFKVKFHGVQEIYHFAVPTVVKRFDEYRMQTLLANSLGTKHVLDVAAKYKAKVVFGSAAVVYGARKADTSSFVETDLGVVDHLNPRGCYNEGKKFAETMCQTYADVHGLDVKIARIFRTFGPRMPLHHGHQIPDCILNALDGNEIVISGSEQSVTALAYVSDIVDGIMRLMKAEPGVGPVNLGSDVDMPIGDVVKKIIELTESSSTVRFEPAPPFLVELGLPNLTKAKEKLAWVPLVRFEDGLKKTIDYVRANKVLLSEG
ncbi:GDP-mannose 4,6-dehydratase [Candidatus Uhrbacteria bacterium]|nr:GDP-mannose 4,6-dehydratase [Candidatus Uhrbacteria bacterium]